MKPDENTPQETNGQTPSQEGQPPADALSRTPEDLEEEASKNASANPDPDSGQPKISPVKKFFRKVNIYFLIFILITVVAGAIAIVNYLNSQKPTPAPDIATQSLTEDTLKQLANSDATVGGAAQTLTVQGNAVIAGQTLLRGDLNVAGDLQTGGNIKTPGLTVSGDSNLASVQINTLQVASDVAIQGDTTTRNLKVSGSSSFSGPLSASKITATQLVLSGNAILEIPNHISFTGPSPSRTIDSSVLGGGGSLSINGSDTAGTININSGNSPSAGCFARINFKQAFPSHPHVIVSPVGSAAGKLQYYVNRDPSGFSLCTSTAATANQTFGFDYFVTY